MTFKLDKPAIGKYFCNRTFKYKISMGKEQNTAINSFFIAGINYKKSDAAVRGQFSVNEAQYLNIIEESKKINITDFFVLSTCNRTEIFGFAADNTQLSKLLCSQTEGSLEKFNQLAYHKNGKDAIQHLFNVAAGLDSQILGDYEIVGQIKKATKFAKQHDCMSAYLERLINEVLQASKKIRTTTGLSGGTVSVSFAAVQFAQQYFSEVKEKKVLLLGTGKIGSNTCKNIVDYLPGCRVTLMNRTIEKAENLAKRFSLSFDHMDHLQLNIDAADIIIVATNAHEPIIKKEHIQVAGNKLIIDLSIPCNVASDVEECAGIELVNVDKLSLIKDKTIEMRKAEIPKVKAIIAEHIQAFEEWHDMRKHVPVLKAVKMQLYKMQSLDYTVVNLCEKKAEEKIQKVINGMAVKMRICNTRGCHYIEAMNDFISSAAN